MPINRISSCIFVHIPKCGGSSVEKGLGMEGEECYKDNTTHIFQGVKFCKQHYTPSMMRQELGDFFDKTFKFTFLRNTYSRVLSQYFYRIDKDRVTGSKKYTVPAFIKWIKAFYENIDNCHKLSQLEYLKDVNYDFIGFVETFEDDWNKLTSMLNIGPRKLPHVKNSDSYKYSEKFITPEVKKIINHMLPLENEIIEQIRRKRE